jgi:hypothetical protein
LAARTRNVYAKIAVLRKIICNRAASIIFCADYQCLKKTDKYGVAGASCARQIARVPLRGGKCLSFQHFLREPSVFICGISLDGFKAQ